MFSAYKSKKKIYKSLTGLELNYRKMFKKKKRANLDLFK